jgi:Ribbon-helix-helix protein, copG family
MEANGEAMKTKTKSVKKARREWPADKAIPRFSNPEEEDTFWQSYEFNDAMEKHGEARPVGFSARQAKARAHVYRIRFDDAEMSALQSMADRRGVSASVIIRELVRAQWSRLAGREADHPKR